MKKYDEKASAEARKKELAEITEKLERGVREVFTSDGYLRWLSFCARLPRYSVNNQILIMLQKPDATLCQSFAAWKASNRYVKKGEKGIRILAPAPFKIKRERDVCDDDGKPVYDLEGERVKEEEEITINAFKPVSTFDLSQTDGDPLPSVGVEELTGSVEGYERLFGAIRDAVPVPVTFDRIESGAKGYYHLADNRIVLAEGMSEAQNVKTLLHEASHQALHSLEAMKECKKSKEQKEVEAEGVAYVVCRHFGIDTSSYSFGYVATWSKGREIPELRTSLNLIRTTAASLIEAIEEKLNKENNKEKKGEKIA